VCATREALMSAALRAYAEREQAVQGGDGSEDAAPLSGKRVEMHGLLARPDLNGRTGDATQFSSESGRYTVVVEGGSETVALKPANLRLVKRNDADATAFAPGTRVKLKGLAAKPELNGCGGTVEEWNEAKERYVVTMDGSLQNMLLRAGNLERNKLEAWSPAMHDPATAAHIRQEFERYAEEQMKNANPFASMGLDEKTMEQVNERSKNPPQESWRE
jgi:hypothetical protein